LLAMICQPRGIRRSAPQRSGRSHARGFRHLEDPNAVPHRVVRRS
jgi:hypothetical protein